MHSWSCGDLQSSNIQGCKSAWRSQWSHTKALSDSYTNPDSLHAKIQVQMILWLLLLLLILLNKQFKITVFSLNCFSQNH